MRRPHYDQICPSLNSKNISGIPRWHYLIEDYYKDNKDDRFEIRKTINDLNSAYFESGNNALAFLNSLAVRKPDLTCKTFKEVARKRYIRRIDIAESSFISDDSKLLINLSPYNKAGLAGMLNSTSRHIPGWEYFADEFGFKYDDKREIENSKRDSIMTPAEKMIQEIFIKDDLPFSKFKEMCATQKFFNVVQKLDEIEKELSKEPLNDE